MRKKSHIGLSRFLVTNYPLQNMQKELVRHRKAFYLGSILPDLKPTFITRKHDVNSSYQLFRKKVEKLISPKRKKRGINTRAYMRNLGEVSHYAADFFTFPHNESYHGNIKDHCKYEKALKQPLKSYLRDSKTEIEKIDVIAFKYINQLIIYFKQSHRAYLKRRNKIEEDCIFVR